MEAHTYERSVGAHTDASSAAEPRWLDPREREVWLALRHLLWGLTPAVDRQLLRDSSLSGPEYSVLATLSEDPEGVMRSGTAARLLGWGRSRLSHLLRRMEAKGLISRACSADDGRGQDITLTPAGKAAIVEAAPGHVGFVRSIVFDPLTEEQQEALREACERITAAIEAEDGCAAAFDADGEPCDGE
ncbi:MarR family winged helix-turn-helix transcriptional regulator [Sinomonas sp. JGH33]|uniref:MarR family winged helix-turn-helix transcriptional regulator n=1 Tax=Sinomonas terricola TaxID=3110330 RepID=A0ABU5TBV7_9MICC|nr:MarR family winged helix-turn-helix transcriptional regulator [Sinomonas sp. JGH33]MEA5457174.1 MarR family winged helix-turn-helix transcriptional regulator [Sinomonas sp. JGH33]